MQSERRGGLRVDDVLPMKPNLAALVQLATVKAVQRLDQNVVEKRHGVVVYRSATVWEYELKTEVIHRSSMFNSPATFLTEAICSQSSLVDSFHP